MNINSTTPYNQNFQARIKINKGDAAKILLGGAALATTGLYTAQSGFQRDIVGSVDLDSANDIQSVKNYVEEGREAIERHWEYLEAHEGKPSDLEGLDRFMGMSGLASSAVGSYISKIGASALYKGEIDKDNAKLFFDDKKLPS